MKELLGDLERWRSRGERIALARVVATRRSAPRPVGSKLAISEGGDLAGSVSGGCVENEVYEAAQEVLRGGEPRLLTYGISDDLALSVGLPCGGEIDVWVDEPDPALLERLAEIVRADVFGPPPRLLVYGAVDTAEALCAAAGGIGWRTIVADARGRFATSERIPSADEVIVAWPEETLAQVEPDHATAIVVLTHDDKFDLPMLTAALETEAFYIGALGARRNQERRRERLLEAGVDEEALERLRGPAGLDIGAQTPAEMLAVRADRDGGPLRTASGRIHAEIA